jgi:hypothetical protein
MARFSPEGSSAAWTLARNQHGLVTRRQLLALGFSADAVTIGCGTGACGALRVACTPWGPLSVRRISAGWLRCWPVAMMQL